MVLLGAIDQGTSSSRFLAFEADTGELVTSHQVRLLLLDRYCLSFSRLKSVNYSPVLDGSRWIQWKSWTLSRLVWRLVLSLCFSLSLSLPANNENLFSTVFFQKVAENLDQMGISVNEMKSIGLANQRETTVVWDRETGKPLYNAIVWLDTRTSSLAEESIARTETKSKDFFKEKTGLPIHPYFSALKLRWLLTNVPEVQAAREKGSLLQRQRQRK